jgi:protein-L-isoaspartate(D-aspartate) O-methyltransferase
MTVTFRGIGMTSQRTRNRLIERLRSAGINHAGVLEVMREIPRHIFVDEALASRAYEETALPIGHGQSISQPFVVARMTEVLVEGMQLKRVLEIGTGCGYQTAVLAALVGRVFSVERIADLLALARERLRVLRLGNVRLKHTDGKEGWPEQGPYDGILVTAAPTGVPDALLQQLAPQGRLIIPVGASGVQRLMRITRTGDSYEEQLMEPVSFVPMQGGVA